MVALVLHGGQQASCALHVMLHGNVGLVDSVGALRSLGGAWELVGHLMEM